MTAHPWMPLYIGDYLADTRRLRAAEHGAYLLLIMEYWQTGSLPDDDRQLARIATMTDREWKAARPIIETLFQPGWKHKRIDAELTKASAMSVKRSAAGKAGASVRYGKRMAEVGIERGNRIANALQSDSIVRVGLQPHSGSTSLGLSEPREKKAGLPEGSSAAASASIPVSAALAAKFSKPKPAEDLSDMPDIPPELRRTG